ncbi:MAG: TIGR03086 family metal-binding protein [Acidothermaceae bacterium]
MTEKDPMDTWPDLLAETYDVLRPSIAMIDDTLLDRPTPCAEWTLRQLVAHTVNAIEMFAVAAERGEPVAASTEGEGAALERFDAAVRRNLAAWRSLADPTATLTLHFGEFPAQNVAAINQLDSLLHGWDIGVALGLPITLPEALSEVAMRMALVRVPLGRGRVFGTEVATAGVTSSETLLGFSGRDPAAWPNKQRRSA